MQKMVNASWPPVAGLGEDRFLTCGRAGAYKDTVMRVMTMAVLLAGATAWGDSSVSLQPAASQDAQAAYRRADFSLRNETGQVVRALRFRSRDGGPAIVVEAVAAPNAPAEGSVPLPAFSPRQTYDVALLAAPEDADEGRALANLSAEISWPAELVNSDRLLNWRYDRVDVEPATWPGGAKRNLLLVLCVAVILLAAAGLLGRHAAKDDEESPSVAPAIWKWLAMGAIVASATITCAWLLAGEGLVISESAVIGEGDLKRPLLAVSARRTATARLVPASVPLYVTRDQMESDTTVIYVGREASAAIRPGNVKLFEQPGGPQPLPGGENLSPLPPSSSEPSD